MRAEIVTIGAELLEGVRVDTNAAYLGRRLSWLGAQIGAITSVRDDSAAIADAVGRALDRSDIVVTTGGLGPTSDDLTKQAVGRLLGRKLVLDESVLESVRAHFERRELAMPEINISQAMIPEGARPIGNAVGTAPGLAIEHEDGVLFVLPGVPLEMESMVEGYVVPFLEGRGLRRLAEERLLRTTGMAESRVAEIVDPLARRLARVDVAYLPSRRGVDVRVVGRGDTPAQAIAAVEPAAERLADALGSVVYATGEESLEQVVGYLLTMAGKTVAVGESCTGGLLGGRLTSVPGSSDYFVGGVIAYSNDVKRRMLGVTAATLRQYGAVSSEVALEMAVGAAAKGKSDYGIGVTGIAGPGGGTPDKPVGVVCVALAGGRWDRASDFRFQGGRDAVRDQAAQAALDMLRRALLGIDDEAAKRMRRASTSSPRRGKTPKAKTRKTKTAKTKSRGTKSPRRRKS